MTPSYALRPVRLTARNLDKITVREWGAPSWVSVGRLWRSEHHRAVVCALAGTYEARAVLIEDRHEDQWLPATWRRAITQYAKQWPDSAPRLHRVPFLPTAPPRSKPDADDA